MTGRAFPTGTPVPVTPGAAHAPRRAVRGAGGAGAWRRAVRGLVTVAVAAFLVGVLPAVAFAHVVVSPDTATQGGYAALTFRVPNERDEASTTQIEVQLPVETPLASVSVKPHPGWSYEITKTKLSTPIEAHGAKIGEVVGKITWTATDEKSAIKPGEYDEFSVSAGPLPEADQLVFKTLQHYSNGEVVRWIQEQAPGAEEPERPAPVIKLVPAGGGHATAAAPPAGTGPAALAADTTSVTGADARAPWALGLSVAALLISLACATTLLVRWRRTG